MFILLCGFKEFVVGWLRLGDGWFGNKVGFCNGGVFCGGLYSWWCMVLFGEGFLSL